MPSAGTENATAILGLPPVASAGRGHITVRVLVLVKRAQSAGRVMHSSRLPACVLGVDAHQMASQYLKMHQRVSKRLAPFLAKSARRRGSS